MNTALLGVSLVCVSISFALYCFQLPPRSSLVTLLQPSRWLQSAAHKHYVRPVTGKAGEETEQRGEHSEVILRSPCIDTNATASASDHVSTPPKNRCKRNSTQRTEQVTGSEEIETTNPTSRNKRTAQAVPALIFPTQEATSVTTRHNQLATTTPLSPTQPIPTQLMPPPRLPPPWSTPNLPKPPSTTLRIPTTGPLPNRNPPPTSPPSTLLTAPQTLAPIPKPTYPRQKVILKPGHSPLDWAALTRSGANLSGVLRTQRITPAQLARNNGRKNRPAWSAWQGRVYNITPYLPFHPGGADQLMRGAGRGAEKLFLEVHPWVNWENMLTECLVGFLVVEGNGEQRGGGTEEMD